MLGTKDTVILTKFDIFSYLKHFKNFYKIMMFDYNNFSMEITIMVIIESTSFYLQMKYKFCK